MNDIIKKIKTSITGSKYESKIYLVGGIVRDEILGLQPNDDIDIVLEGSASQFAAFLFDKGICDHFPVEYPRFGTAMVSIDNCQVEIVGARKESYLENSRKPYTITGTLKDDIYRRDFTINTLLKNINTGEIQDLTNSGLNDIKAGIIRTPLDPKVTFKDDPLRMLRALRFAARFNFTIDSDTYIAIIAISNRLNVVSSERVRDEFIKIVMNKSSFSGLELLRETGLLKLFAPELLLMYGVDQNTYHLYDVWYHTLKVIDAVPIESGLTIRLAALFHDIGKPQTKSIDEKGYVHFYEHQRVGAQMAKDLMQRLSFPNSVINDVCFIISMHLRVGEYDEFWSDSAIRRLLRDTGEHLDNLFLLTEADKSASNLEMPSADLNALKDHIKKVINNGSAKIESPLSGREIMETAKIDQGPMVGRIKEYLENEIIEGNLKFNQRSKAKKLVESFIKNNNREIK